MSGNAADEMLRAPRVLATAPQELIDSPLRRLGEGIGKVVYASPHWVVKRERSPVEVVALIVLWKNLKRLDRLFPGRFGKRLMRKPSKRLRLLRVMVQGVMAVVPKTVWYSSHIRQVWNQYRFRNARGERLARKHLTGTSLVPELVTFPPTRVQVGGWPGWLTVSEATERVEATLYDRVSRLARSGDYDRLEHWLDRFLALRQEGWSRGLFSTDAHLKNFGIIGDRVVLIDPGGLTNRWSDIEKKLDFEEVLTQPHIQLGLGEFLGARPDVAARFNARWKATVNLAVVRDLWPDK